MDMRYEVIDAFVDGRRVDVAELKRALAEEEGRSYFVDAWLLRESLQDEMTLESAARAGQAQPLHQPQTHPGWRSRHGWILPVAVSLASLIGGALAGYRLAELADSTPAVMAPAIESPSTTPAAKPSFPVPTPTRAIPIEFSSDSSSASGGN